MTLDLVAFDLDGVLVDFVPAARMRLMAAFTGLSAERIQAATWGAPFEPAAEAGAYATGDEYLAAFNQATGVPVTREQWVEARRAAMIERPAVLAYVAGLARYVPVAALTNNGALLRETLPELAPGVAACFGERFHATCEFGARKPEPVVYERLLARYGARPAHSVFIDDSAANVEGAQRAGMHGVLYHDLDTLRAEITRIAAELRCSG